MCVFVLQYDAQYYYSPAPEYDMRSGVTLLLLVLLCLNFNMLTFDVFSCKFLNNRLNSNTDGG